MSTTTGAPEILPRSFLYVPGNRPDLFAKATAGPADALILDLEDAVPLAEKAQARQAVRRWLDATDGQAGPPCWVRVNAESIADDLDAVVRPGLDGIFLAKATPDRLAQAARTLNDLEPARDLPHEVGVIGLVETARALLSLDEMAQSPRLVTFGIGEVDLLGDLRVSRTPRTAAAVDQLRTQVVLGCAAAGLRPPVAPTSTDFRDLDDFAETCRLMLELGFRSRTAIHPGQIAVIHEVFTPSAGEVEAALDVLARFDAAEGGVTVDDSGRLIDAAVVRGARETLGRRSPA
jgi:citrate lyase subunit beta/citryl-CoA lyase